MPRIGLARMACAAVVLTSTLVVLAQSKLELHRAIVKIKAIDNHSHVEQVIPNGGPDTEGDAISCGGLEFVAPPPVRLRTDHKFYRRAREELFGFKGETTSENGLKEYLASKQRIVREKGDAYPEWILDKLNVDTMLANRIAMGPGLRSPRFRWVTYGDPFLLPFATLRAREVNSDVRFFYSQEEKLLTRFLRESKLSALPGSLEAYLNRFVTPTLERQKAQGAVAVKFVAAYYRSLEFENVTRAEAARIYNRYRTSEPTAVEYRRFQDFIFRYVASEAGRLGLVVHVHTGGGCGHYFNLRTANPLLLESVLNDPKLRTTNFVLVHGGYPFVQETAFLLEKPNVYADFSAQTFLLSSESLAVVLRSWLDYEPEKVLFGSDASAAGPDLGWEESAWVTTATARDALVETLSAMVISREITYDRALELANMVLRDNARKLYNLGN